MHVHLVICSQGTAVTSTEPNTHIHTILCLQLGEYDRAVEDYTRALEVDPLNSYAFYNRGITRDRKGDFAGAVADFTTAIELDRGNADFYHNRGFSLRKQVCEGTGFGAARGSPGYLFSSTWACGSRLLAASGQVLCHRSASGPCACQAPTAWRMHGACLLHQCRAVSGACFESTPSKVAGHAELRGTSTCQ